MKRNSERPDFYITEIYELLRAFSTEKLVEFNNKCFRHERLISVREVLTEVEVQELRTELMSRIGEFETEELIRIRNLGRHIQTRRT